MKQFTLNLLDKNINSKNNEIKIGGIDDFNKIKNEIEVLYVIKNDNTKVEGLDNYIIFNKKKHDDYLIETYVRHPYISKIIDIEYVGDDGIMQIAVENKGKMVEKLEENGFGKVHITSVAYGKDGGLIGSGTNSEFHLENGCVRKDLKCKSGEGYELCEGCQPLNHGERNAIKHTREQGKYELLKGATAYMYGHYWACEPCTKAMEKAGITKLLISKSFVKKFLNIQDI